MTEEEKSMYYKGFNKQEAKSLSALLGAKVGNRFLESKEKQANPASLDWRDVSPSVISPVKDQGSCGSCWAFATTEAVESYAAINSGGDLRILSEQQLVDCSSNDDNCGGTGGCSGSIFDLAIDYIVEAGGITTDALYPYTARDGTCKFDTSSTPPSVTVTGFETVPTNDE